MLNTPSSNNGKSIDARIDPFQTRRRQGAIENKFLQVSKDLANLSLGMKNSETNGREQEQLAFLQSDRKNVAAKLFGTPENKKLRKLYEPMHLEGEALTHFENVDGRHDLGNGGYRETFGPLDAHLEVAADNPQHDAMEDVLLDEAKAEEQK